MNILGLTSAGQTAIIVVLSIVGAAILLTLFWAWIIAEKARFTNLRLRKKKTELEVSGADLARTMLDQAGLFDVEIEQCSFWNWFFRANTYSSRKKKIFLTRRVYNKNRIQNVSTISMLVGLAKLDADGDKNAKRVGKLGISQVALAIMIPLVVVGIIIDVALYTTPGIVSLIISIVGFLVYLGVFIASLTTVKSVKAANQIGLEIVESMGVLNEEEFALVNKVCKMNYKLYIANTLLSALYVLKFIINVIWTTLKIVTKTKGK